MSDIDRVISNLDRLTDRLGEVVTELKVVASRQADHKDELLELRAEVEVERKLRVLLEQKVDKWINRGWGAWGVVIAIFTVVTALNWPQQLMTPTETPKRPALSQSTSGRP